MEKATGAYTPAALEVEKLEADGIRTRNHRIDSPLRVPVYGTKSGLIARHVRSSRFRLRWLDTDLR